MEWKGFHNRWEKCFKTLDDWSTNLDCRMASVGKSSEANTLWQQAGAAAH